MKALLLAAGKGTRISRYLSGNPKSTVDIGGVKLIEYTVSLLKKKGVDEIGIVLGYCAEEIKKLLKHENNIKFYLNPFYEITNSMGSIWFAKDFIDDDILIMNADVFLEEKLLDFILASNESPVLFSDESRKKEADYKLYYENGILKDYGKELPFHKVTGEYIGVAKFNKTFIKVFKDNLDKMINEKKYNLWWENVIYDLTNILEIKVKDIKNIFWAEVDYIEDYERILDFRKYKISYSISVKKR